MARPVWLCGILVSTLLSTAPPASAEPLDRALESRFAPHRTRIGIQVQSMTPELREFMLAPRDRGLLVARVQADRPAARAGLKVGDVIVSAGGEPVDRPLDLVRVVARAPAGESLDLGIFRNGKELVVPVQPEAEPTPWIDPEHWAEQLERGMRRGSEELRRRLEQLEERLEDLERRIDRLPGLPGTGEQRT